jgi:syntaxin 1B/2/3
LHRYRDVRKLEQSVIELNQMFQELAMLIEQQGEVIDQIEFNVANTKEFTSERMMVMMPFIIIFIS